MAFFCNQKKIKCLFYIVIAILVCNSESYLLANSSVDATNTHSGIQISLAQDSFISIFEGIAKTIMNNWNKDTIYTSKGNLSQLQFNMIDNPEIKINRDSSRVEFLSDSKLRIILAFSSLNIPFSFQMRLLDFIQSEDKGQFLGQNFEANIDMSISSNVNNTLSFDITRFDLQQNNFLEIRFNNKLYEILFKLLFNFNEFIQEILRTLLTNASKVEMNKLFSTFPTQVKIGTGLGPGVQIPPSEGILDLSIKGLPFFQDGYFNIPISGITYIPSKYQPILNRQTVFNPSKNNKSSTQIFIGIEVINRLIETFIFKQFAFNYTQPVEPSSVSPLDSHSLSPVFPGLRKLKNIHFPIIETILSQNSIKFQLKDNKLQAKVTVGLNLYMREANKAESLFKYNNNIVSAVVNVTLNILNSKNYLTVNIASVSLESVLPTPEDASLIDIEQIMYVSPLFCKIVQDSNNYAIYKNYLDLNNILGLSINNIDIIYEDDQVRLDLSF